MKVEILNQYTQKWNDVVEASRTRNTLEQLKERLDFNGNIVDGNWSDDGQVTVTKAILQDAQGSVARANEFNKKPFGKEEYHTLEEVLKSDLAYVNGYGIIEDKKDFENEFKVAAQKNSIPTGFRSREFGS